MTRRSRKQGWQGEVQLGWEELAVLIWEHKLPCCHALQLYADHVCF